MKVIQLSSYTTWQEEVITILFQYLKLPLIVSAVKFGSDVIHFNILGCFSSSGDLHSLTQILSGTLDHWFRVLACCRYNILLPRRDCNEM